MLNFYNDYKNNRFSDFNEKSGIYMLKINSLSYIGSSSDLSERLRYYKNKTRDFKCHNDLLNDAIFLYGLINLEYEILEYTTDLFKREQFYIDLHNPFFNKKNVILSDNPLCLNYIVNSKQVYMYSLNGEYLDVFVSCSEASRQLNKRFPSKKFQSNGIAAVANKNLIHMSHNGFRFSYEKLEKLDEYVNNSDKAKVVSINMHDITGTYLKSYNSIAEAARSIANDLISKQEFDKLCACISQSSIKNSDNHNNKYDHVSGVVLNKYFFSRGDNYKTTISVDKIYTSKIVLFNEKEELLFENIFVLDKSFNLTKSRKFASIVKRSVNQNLKFKGYNIKLL